MVSGIPAFEQINISNGMNLYLCPTDHFKSVYLKIFIHLPLDENATANALITRVLPRGCKKYPNMRKIVMFLDSLYGAGFGNDVDKIGERHLLELHFESVADRFLPKREHTLEKGLLFFKRLLTEPLVRNNGLFPDYVAQEKQNLRNDIKGLRDNKIAYARQRCIEIMCEDEPYRIYEEGRLEDIDPLTPEILLTRLQCIIRKFPIDIFILGQFRASKIEKAVRQIFSLRRDESITQLPSTIVDKAIDKERTVQEKMPETEQAKLVMGYRTYTTWREEEVFPLIVFNGILGAYPHSKLFLNVREKAGLAYYASSALEKTKGLMLIHAGIAPDKFDLAVRIIKEQLDQIKQGNISDDELSSTIKSIDDRLKALRDNPAVFIGYTLEQLINRRNDSVETIREKIQSVSKESITRIAERVKLDTIYFLANEG